MTAVAEATPMAQRRVLGIALVVASTAFFALAGVFTKAIAADAWTIASWRGLVGFVVIAAYVLIRRYGFGHAGSLRLGWRGWLLAIVGGTASIAFISSFKYTFVANVTIIYATVPFAAENRLGAEHFVDDIGFADGGAAEGAAVPDGEIFGHATGGAIGDDGPLQPGQHVVETEG